MILPDLIFIIFLIDRVGRRKPLLWGTIGITIALICEAIVNSQINTEAPQNGLSIAGVFFLFCVTVIFSRKFSLGTLRKRNDYNSYSLLGTDILGLHGRGNAHANPRPRECLRNRNRELACTSSPPLPSPPLPWHHNATIPAATR
jgi:Sugar (and other) transporter